MDGDAADNAVQQPAIQDQRLKTRVCDKIVYCISWQTDFANLIMPIGPIGKIVPNGPIGKLVKLLL